MLQGLYTAGVGMMCNEQRHAAIANNIANAQTPGFRRQLAIQQGYYSVNPPRGANPYWFNRVAAPGGGVQLVETFSNTQRGAITQTGDPLHVALDGPGFIAVDTPRGERFTRNGRLSVDVDGFLATMDGQRVQNAGGGAIDVRGGELAIDSAGTVRVGGQVAGQVRVVEFEDPHMLTREGHSLLAASQEAIDRSAPGVNTELLQGSSESSNVEVPTEIINMILAMRAYGANQKVVTSFDETMGQLIERVGSPM